MEKVRNLAPGKEVLVLREDEGWTPYTFVRVSGNNVDVILPSGKISSFAIIIVRPFQKENDEVERTSSVKNIPVKTAETEMKNAEPLSHQMVTHSRARKDRTESTTYYAVAGVPDKEFYHSLRMEEINALTELGCLKVVPQNESRAKFVDNVKLGGDKHSRLCVAACNDQKNGLFTSASTIKRLSLRLILFTYT